MQWHHFSSGLSDDVYTDFIPRNKVFRFLATLFEEMKPVEKHCTVTYYLFNTYFHYFLHKGSEFGCIVLYISDIRSADSIFLWYKSADGPFTQ